MAEGMTREDFIKRGPLKDFAQLGKGGIDLTPANMNLQTKMDSRVRGNDKGIQFHIDHAMLQQLQNASGFVPVIINIQPMTDLRQFLGVSAPSLNPSR